MPLELLHKCVSIHDLAKGRVRPSFRAIESGSTGLSDMFGNILYCPLLLLLQEAKYSLLGLHFPHYSH